MRLATGLNLALAVLVASTSYAATVTWVPSDTGTSTHVVIDHVTPAMPGLAASVDLQLTSFSSTAFAFTATLHNDSDPSTTSRLSAFGFNVDSAVAGADVNGAFNNPGFVLNGNFPELGDVDICFTNGNTCPGGGGTGIATLASGTFTANVFLTEPVSAITLSNFSARLQSVQLASATETPEPTTFCLAGVSLVF